MRPHPSTAVVFVTNVHTRHDYAPAKEYGERLVPLTKHMVDLENAPALVTDIHSALADANPQDYLLLDGPPLISVIAALFLYTKFGRVNVLIWDTIMQEYRHHELNAVAADVELP